MKATRLTALILSTVLCISLAACASPTPADTSVQQAKSALQKEETAAQPEENGEQEKETAVHSEESIVPDGNAAADIAGETEEKKNYLTAKYMDDVQSVETKTFPLYMGNVEKVSEISLAIINGMEDIPYIEVNEAADLLNEIKQLGISYEDFELTVDETLSDEGYVVFERENGAIATFDFNKDEVVFSDYDLFVAHPAAINAFDMTTVKTKSISAGEYMAALIEAQTTGKTYDAEANKEGVNLFNKYSVLYSPVYGVTLSLSDYCIDLVQKDGKSYIPLQFLSDIFVSVMYFTNVLYNGKCVIIAPFGTIVTADGSPTELAEIYNDAVKGAKSEEMIQFNLNELMMVLDFTYGLSEEHGIDNFNDFFANTDLAKYFITDNAEDTFNALVLLAVTYLADKHTAALAKSPMVGEDQKVLDEGSIMMDVMMHSDVIARVSTESQKYNDARAAYYPEGIKGYEEVGNTAYLTFDSFMFDENKDYYNTQISNTVDDTLILLFYANSQIHRENSPIENVVIDLTCNGGGTVDAAISVISWFLGEGRIAVKNSKSGAMGITSYMFDCNLDKEFNDKDNVKSYNLYCLTSPLSFSCGNLVPAAFKSSGAVTIIGKTTGGGACAVNALSTADGNLFTASSARRLSSVKNGSFYSVDQGVEPDVYIDDISHFYDRQYMTDLINNLD